MNVQERADLAVSLLRRAGNAIYECANNIEDIYDNYKVRPEGGTPADGKLAAAMVCLEAISDLVSDRPPDETWWRDYFLLTGEHMILTDEGWVPPYMVDPQSEVLEEVNAK